MVKRHIIAFLLMVITIVCASTVMAQTWDRGSRGDGVLYVQDMLVTQGYLEDTVDGVFGNNTEYAVRAFQKEHNLDVDGRVGPATLAALEKNNLKFTSKPSKYKLSANTTSKQGSPNSYRKVLMMEASAYSAYDPGNTHYTANGNLLKKGYVSVDPRVIPLGTKLYVEGYGYAVADDTGGAIVGHRIDLAMDSYDDAIQFGRRSVKVYIL